MSQEPVANTATPAKKKPLDLQSYGIFIVIACSILSYLFIYHKINVNIVQYTPKVKTFSVYASHKSEGDTTVIAFTKNTIKNDSTKDAFFVVEEPYEKGQLVPGANIKLRHYVFHKNSMFMVWLMLILVMVTLAGGCFAGYIFQIVDLMQKHNLKWQSLANSALFLACIGLFLWQSNKQLQGYNKPDDIINQFGILLKNGAILDLIVNFTVFLISPLLFYMFMIGMACDHLVPEKDDQQELEAAAKKLEKLNGLLRTTLRVLSCVVAFSVITSSALRLAIKNALNFDEKTFDVFPAEASLVYGLYFSLFLGIMYVPIYLYLKHTANKLRTKIKTKQSTPEEKTWGEQMLGRIKFDGSLTENFKLAMIMFTPFITSVLPASLHGIFNQ
ncbi:MAG TPA: hypothetical protein VD905_16240 [Flavobacteriales bacterium]|nr:hypothetical protein [Flavobacteriales bacterium]